MCGRDCLRHSVPAPSKFCIVAWLQAALPPLGCVQGRRGRSRVFFYYDPKYCSELAKQLTEAHHAAIRARNMLGHIIREGIFSLGTRCFKHIGHPPTPYSTARRRSGGAKMAASWNALAERFLKAHQSFDVHILFCCGLVKPESRGEGCYHAAGRLTHVNLLAASSWRYVQSPKQDNTLSNERARVQNERK